MPENAGKIVIPPAEGRALAFILLANAAAALAYALLCRLRRREAMGEALLRCAVMLLFPVAGPCWLLFGALWRRLFFRRPARMPAFGPGHRRANDAPSCRVESLAPLEEAAAVADASDARALMLEVVRRGPEASLPAISAALRSGDSELSHYAATVLQDSLGRFFKKARAERERVRNLAAQPAGGATDAALPAARALLVALDDMLALNILGREEAREAAAMLDDMARLIDRQGAPAADELAAAARARMRESDWPAARRWCDRLEALYPETPAAYACRLKLCGALGERERFFSLLDALKRSGLTPDPETRAMLAAFTPPNDDQP